MEKNRSTGVIVALLAVVILVGGLVWWQSSNNDDTNENTSNTSQSASQSDMAASEQAQNSRDIVEIAGETSTLSTLVGAVQAADLVSTLQGDGPFTVFAPTNDAFAALPAGALDNLLKPENKEQLKSVLTYHVVAGKVMAADLKDGQEVTTVQGNKLTVKLMDDSVYLTDATGAQAMVSQADVAASNGVVHIIDKVVMPQ